jgi:hypothetical protein
VLPLTKREKYELLKLLEDLKLVYDRKFIRHSPEHALVVKYLDLIWKHLDD